MIFLRRVSWGSNFCFPLGGPGGVQGGQAQEQANGVRLNGVCVRVQTETNYIFDDRNKNKYII